MAPKTPDNKLARSTTKPKLLKRLSTGLSFSKKNGATKATETEQAGSPAVSKADADQIRYVLIDLPVGAGEKFAWIVDDVEMVFTVPAGKKVGEPYEFKFTFSGGPIVEDATPAAVAQETATPPTSEVVPSAPTASPTSEAKKADLASETTQKAIDGAIANASDVDSIALDVATTAVEGAIKSNQTASQEGLVTEVVSAAVDGAIATVDSTSDGKLRSWQQTPPAGGGSGVAMLVLVLAILVGMAVCFDLPSKLELLLAPPLPPPPPPPKKFLGIF